MGQLDCNHLRLVRCRRRLPTWAAWHRGFHAWNTKLVRGAGRREWDEAEGRMDRWL